MPPDSSHQTFFRRNSGQIARLTMLFVISLWGFCAYWATITRQETLNAAETHLSSIVHAVKQYSSSHFRMAEIFQATTEHWLEATPRRDPRLDPKFSAFIGEFRQRTDDLIDLRIAATNGDLYYFRGDSAQPRDNVADRTYFNAAINNPPGITHFGAPVISRVSGEWRLPITKRMQRPHHDLAVINASFNISALLRTFEIERPKPDGTIALWKQDGTVLARAPHIEGLLGTRPIGDQSHLNPVFRNDSGVFVTQKSVIDQTARLVGHAKLDGLPLFIVVTLPLSGVLASWYQQLTLVCVALALVTLAGMLISLHLVNASRLQERYTGMIEEMALLDPLTGIANRRQFFDTGKREFSRSHRSRRVLSVLMLDLDYFKKINDRWGHPTGDLVLKTFSTIVASGLRQQDCVGRLGGEEFAVILPETSAAEAAIIAERIRHAVESSETMHAESGESVRITVSIGIASIADDITSFEALLSRADRCLYQAKGIGRNRVVYDDTPAPGETATNVP